MKKLFLIFSFCLLTVISMGQTIYPLVDQYGRPTNYRVSAYHSKVQLSLSVDKQTKSIYPFNTIPNDSLGTIVFLDGAKKVTLTTLVRKDSLSYYRYSVFENDSTVIIADAKLTKVDFAWPENSDYPGYLTMNLGVSNIVNKKLTVKIYRLPKANLVTTLIIYNKPLKPAQIVKITLLTQEELLKSFPMYSYVSHPLKNDTAFKVTDKTKGIYFNIEKIDPVSIYHVYIWYDGAYHTVAGDWNYTRTGPSFFIDKSNFNKPGDYKVIVAANININDPIRDSLATQFSFKVLSPLQKYALLLWLLGVVIINILVAIFKRRRNRKKLAAATQQTETAKSELNMVRAQLNPHFVFNALSGIQNLMNKNEVEMANNYLNKFARLTRQVLDDKSLISIRDEMSLLEDYLAMEQLRFSFTYEINADNSDNFLNIEIPAMLLQPFVENAVKHGMTQLKNDGKIVVNFIKEDKQLILTVMDNGKGFNTSLDYEGWGLKLSKKRIALLNDVYKECPINLDIDSNAAGTTIKITLAHWL